MQLPCRRTLAPTALVDARTQIANVEKIVARVNIEEGNENENLYRRIPTVQLMQISIVKIIHIYVLYVHVEHTRAFSKSKVHHPVHVLGCKL